jgi:type II secretory pathway pseudopilin PulG
MKEFSSERGYTIIELTAVLLLTAVVLLLFTATFQSGANRIEKQVSQLIGALRLARAKAVLKGRPAGVKFDVAGNSYRVFEDVGPDGLGPADLGYPGKDEGEANGDYDDGEPSQPASTLLGDAVVFGFSTTNASMVSPEGEGTTIGDSSLSTMDPVPAKDDALVFDLRGRLMTPTAGNPPPYFVYLFDIRTMDMRAVRVDPWTGSVRGYRWVADAGVWSHQ